MCECVICYVALFSKKSQHKMQQQSFFYSSVNVTHRNVWSHYVMLFCILHKSSGVVLLNKGLNFVFFVGASTCGVMPSYTTRGHLHPSEMI